MSRADPELAPAFQASDFSESLLRARSRPVSVCIPVLNEAATIGAIVETLAAMRADGLIDQVVVLDAASTDGSRTIAAQGGAEVFDQSSLMAEHGPARGKGDAIWRSLAVLSGDLLCYFDGDLDGFSRSYVVGLLGALLTNPDVEFVKAAFSRPFRDERGRVAGEAGRVTEEMARPMLERFYPALCRFRQPLSGQFAVSRKLLGSLPLSTGYGVDVGLLIDVYRAVGIGRMAEVDIGRLQNAHQTLTQLEPMAYQVGLAVRQRLESEGRLAASEPSPGGPAGPYMDVIARPPFDAVRAPGARR